LGRIRSPRSLVGLKLQFSYGIRNAVIDILRTPGEALGGLPYSVSGTYNPIHLFSSAGIVVTGQDRLKDGRSGDDSGEEDHPSLAYLHPIENLLLSVSLVAVGIGCFCFGLPLLIYFDVWAGSPARHIIAGILWCSCGIIIEVLAGSIVH
jgi:hypothetical protein